MLTKDTAEKGLIFHPDPDVLVAYALKGQQLDLGEIKQLYVNSHISVLELEALLDGYFYNL